MPLEDSGGLAGDAAYFLGAQGVGSAYHDIRTFI